MSRSNPRPDSGFQPAEPPTAASAAAPRRWCGYALLVIGVALVAAGTFVYLTAPEGTTLEIPIGRRGRGKTTAGLWAIYTPAAIALFGSFVAMTSLTKPENGQSRFWWLLMFGLGAIAAFAILGGQALG